MIVRALSRLTLLSALIGTAWAAPDIPGAPEGYILDDAGILSDSTEYLLSSQLTTLDAETSTQIVVVTTPDLQGYPIEEYALEIGRDWGVGQDEYDNGLVLLIAPVDRETRIEVGYGLEGVITDAESSHIINSLMIPHFREGDYDSGVVDAVDRLEALARFEVFPTQPEPSSTFFEWLANFLILVFWIVYHLASTKSWWLGGVIGAVIGGIVYSWAGFFIGALVGLGFDWLISRLFAKPIAKQRARARKSGRSRGGRWGSGGGSSGGGFGGFGGGGFGGGGASGRW